jgi:hypothetical protein
VRLKITKPLAGSIDGLHLDRFAVGGLYDVGTSLANYLLAIGAAEPAGDEETAGASDRREVFGELRRRISGSRTASRGNFAKGKVDSGKPPEGEDR